NQVAALSNPNRSFGKLKAFRQLEDLGIGANDFIDGRIFSNHLHIDFTGCDGNGPALTSVEVESSQPHPDEVGRWIRQGAIRTEDGELNLLTWPYIATDNEPVGGVPACHDRTAALPHRSCQFAVDPDFGVIVY